MGDLHVIFKSRNTIGPLISPGSRFHTGKQRNYTVYLVFTWSHRFLAGFGLVEQDKNSTF